MSLVTSKALVVREISKMEDQKIGNGVEPTPQAISRSLRMNYGYTTKLISQLEDEEIVRSSEEGRRKVLSLTDSGRAISEAVKGVLDTTEDMGDRTIANSRMFGEEDSGNLG